MLTVKQWIEYFSDYKLANEFLSNDYGVEYPYLNEKRNLILSLLRFHGYKFGNENIIIVRAPGRINLMGRHVDHQGSPVNLIAIDQEIFITASLRPDKKIMAYNIDESSFNEVFIDFGNLDSYIEDEWIKLINNNAFIEKYRLPKGKWDNYIRAAYLRLINYFKKKEIFGANICVSGNILIAAGLSSSTALNVGVFSALCYLNNLDFSENDFINVCAEAEWFVGTRGGCADQVAIKFSRLNQIAHIKLFDFEIIDWIEFPKDKELLIFNSNIIADKSGSKKDLFNEKILAYEIGFNLIKMKHPQYAHKLFHLRDINPENLRLKSVNFINILYDIPEYVEYNELARILGEKWDNIKEKYQFNEVPKRLAIRKIIAYGLTECERSKKFFELLKGGDIKEAGILMNISHEGDRISNFNKAFELHPFKNELPDKKLNKFVNERVSLEQISGGYGASITELDFVVSLAKSYEGVYGAQLSGAGMGGCVMIFVDVSKSSEIKKIIAENYVKRFDKDFAIYHCKPVKGLSLYSEI